MEKAKLAAVCAAACVMFLAGCGSMDAQDNMPTTTPYVTDDLLNDNMPGTGDMGNGLVKDTDGIIDESDSGDATGKMKDGIDKAANDARSMIDNASNGAKRAVEGMKDRG